MDYFHIPRCINGSNEKDRLLERLHARDAGEADARIRDVRRDPVIGVIGVREVRRASRAIASRVAEVFEAGERALVVGGDCTVLLGVFQALPRGSGLSFIDGHADFLDGESSPTGEAADMDLGVLTGHGPAGLLDSGGPLVDPAAAVLVGHRPGALHADIANENARLDSAIHALTALEVRELGAAEVGADAADRLARRPAWLHLDLDVLDEDVLPAVSYPQPLGLDWDDWSNSLNHSSLRRASSVSRSRTSTRIATRMGSMPARS